MKINEIGKVVINNNIKYMKNNIEGICSIIFN